MNTFLTLKNISKNFSGVKALQNINFSIQKGEIRCLVGENGSGKSTLIKIITGVHKPEPNFSIEINNKEIGYLTPNFAIQNGIAVIYQDLSIFPNLTVCENIYITHAMRNGTQFVNNAKAKKIAELAMKKINVSIPLNEYVENLSIADQQLIAICRAFTDNLNLLIMDEPTTALTRKEVKALFKVIKELQLKNIAILFVSHKLDEVFEISETVSILRDGALVGNFKQNELDTARLAYLMTGKDIMPHQIENGRFSDGPVFEVRNLCKKGNYANVDLNLRKGEVLGITGLLGSGRTELALSLFGLNKMDSGKVFLNNKQLKIESARDAINAGIAYVPENRLIHGLIMDQSVSRNIILTTIDRVLKKIGFIDFKRVNETINHWIKILEIKIRNSGVAVNTLSGGNQQRVVLAKWLATNPKVLILDSPTVGIDIAAKLSIHRIIDGLSKKGVYVIIISDEIQEVFYNCHRVIIMHRGRIVEEIDPLQITEADIHKTINNLE